jgi:hypothetical protein
MWQGGRLFLEWQDSHQTVAFAMYLPDCRSTSDITLTSVLITADQIADAPPCRCVIEHAIVSQTITNNRTTSMSSQPAA